MDDITTIICSVLGIGLVTVSVALIMLITWVIQISKDLNKLKKKISNTEK